MKITHYAIHLVNDYVIRLGICGPGDHRLLLEDFEKIPLNGNLVYMGMNGYQIHIPKRNIMFIQITPEEA